MKKYLITGFTVLTLAIAGFTGASVIKAQGPNDGFAAGLAERFGLNETEVSDYMQQMHEEHMQERGQIQEKNLDQAVTDGVITQEQKDAIVAKREEMQAEREARRQEMQTWYEQQGIDQEALHEYMGFGPGMGGHHGMGMMER